MAEKKKTAYHIVHVDAYYKPVPVKYHTGKKDKRK